MLGLNVVIQEQVWTEKKKMHGQKLGKASEYRKVLEGAFMAMGKSQVIVTGKQSLKNVASSAVHRER